MGKKHSNKVKPSAETQTDTQHRHTNGTISIP